MAKKNAVAIAGLETILEPKEALSWQNMIPKLFNMEIRKVRFFADTFLDSIQTWVKEHPEYDTKIIDARDYCEDPNPIRSIWQATKDAHTGLDALKIACHSNWEGLYIISKYKKCRPDRYRYIEYYTDWCGLTFNPGANIWLSGCQAGGRFGEKWDKCIAQDIANKTGATVWAYTSKSSQQWKDGGYRQVPDTGDYVEFVRKGTL